MKPNIYSLEEFKVSEKKLLEELNDLSNNRIFSNSAASEWTEKEIVEFKKKKEEELEKRKEEISIRYKKECSEKVESFMANLATKCRAFIAQKKHSKREHDEMIQIMNLHGAFTLDVTMLTSSVSAKIAESLLCRIFDENLLHWRKLFGARTKIKEPRTHFFQRIPHGLKLVTLHK